MSTFVCDLDGVLLDTATGFSSKWTEILGKPVTPDMFIHWTHEYALGVDRCYADRFWKEFWLEIELYPYPGAIEFITSTKSLGYKFVLLTSRSSDEAEAAMRRDVKKLNHDFDDIIVCDHRNEFKSTYINEIPDAEFFVDDHIKNVADAKLRCLQLKEVFLYNRQWNTSADLSEYVRTNSYNDIVSRLYSYL